MRKQFDRFVLTDPVAQSADGTLYAGNELLPGGVTRPVTVKVLPPFARAGPGAERRFIDEVRVLAALAGHPHVVTFYGMGITEGVPWVAMEHAPATLAAVIGPSPADPRDVATMVEHVAQGLTSLHTLQPLLLHNRLHPGNILVMAGGCGGYYKVAEFGLAAPASAEPTLGFDSVRYAAPELLSKEVGTPGPAADLYALGHVAYEMALGAKVHRQQFPAVMEGAANPRDVAPAKWQAWHHSLPTTVPPAHEVVKGFPRSLGEVIAKLMAKPQTARYASAADVLADLRRAPVADVPAIAAPPEPAPSAPAGRFQPRPDLRHRPVSMPPPLPDRVGATAEPAAVPRPPVRTPPSALAAAIPAPPPSAPAGGGEKYFVRLRNRTTGPFDLPTLQRMSRQGQLSRLHQVSTDQHTWKSAGTVEGLFS